MYADKLMSVFGDAVEAKDTPLVKALIIAMILLAKEPDETYLLAEKASEWMMEVEFKGSIGEAIELFMKNKTKNGE